MSNFTPTLFIECLLIVLLTAVIFYCQRIYRVLSRIENLEVKKQALESNLLSQILKAEAIKFELGSLVEEAHAQSRSRLVRIEDGPALVPFNNHSIRETMVAAQSLRQRRLNREALTNAA